MLAACRIAEKLGSLQPRPACKACKLACLQLAELQKNRAACSLDEYAKLAMLACLQLAACRKIGQLAPLTSYAANPSLQLFAAWESLAISLHLLTCTLQYLQPCTLQSMHLVHLGKTYAPCTLHLALTPKIKQNIAPCNLAL